MARAREGPVPGTSPGNGRAVDDQDWEDQASGLNPYVGPRSFGEKHSRYFFGRDEERRQLTSLVIAHRVVLFYAQSGAGKTSLLRASVIPELKRRKKVVVLPITRVGGDLPPGVTGEQVANIYVFNALLNLAGAGADPETLTGLSLQEGLAAHVQPEAGERRPHPRLLILDQFEELFTSHPQRTAERAGFFRQLAGCLQAYPQLSLLLSMREDYIARLDYYAAQMPNRLRTRFRMERLPVLGALEAVQKPAECAGRPFEPGVGEGLVDNLRRIQVGAAREGVEEQTALGEYVEPVHLQIVCWQLWENLPPGGDTIRAEDVQAFGDVDQALSEFYEGTLGKVAGQTGIGGRRVRSWFDEEMITPAQTRGLVYRDREESGGLPNEAVDILREAYIIRAVIRGGDTWYELAHDRLVEPILVSNRTWRETHLSPLQRQAELWEEQGRPAGLLLRDEALEDAEEWAAANPAELADVERGFLRECREARAVAERERQQARRIRWLAVGATIFSIIAIVLAIVAGLQTSAAQKAATDAEHNRQVAVAEGQRADRQRDAALDAQGTAIAEADARATEVVVREAAEAAAMIEANARATAQVEAEIREEEALDAQAEAERQARIALSGALAASASNALDVDPELGILLAMEAVSLTQAVDGTVTEAAEEALHQALWSSRIRHTLTDHTEPLSDVAFGPDGTQLATSSGDKTLKIWDASSGELLLDIDAQAVAQALAFSPDGARLASGGGEKLVRLWDTASGQELLSLPGHTAAIWDITISPDGAHLATASGDGTVGLWDAISGTLVYTLPAHADEVHGVAFSPDGARLASAGNDRTAKIWNTLSGEELLALEGHGGKVTDVAFSYPDGEYLATSSTDGTATVWHTSDGQERCTIYAHQPSQVYRVAFSPNGQYLVTTSADGTAKVWNPATCQELFTLNGHTDSVWGLALSPDSTRLATASRDGTAKVWDVSPGAGVFSLSGHTGEVYDIAFGPDGKRLASASQDGTARVWDAVSGELLLTLGRHADEVLDVAYSTDGEHLATASKDGTAKVWSAASGELLQTLSSHTDWVFAVAFSPDSKYLATAGWDGWVRVWDVSTGEQTFAVIAHARQVRDVVFSPDGASLVTVSNDSSAKVWDLASGQELRTLDPKHARVAVGVAFSQGGRSVATSAEDRTAKIWDTASWEERFTLEGHTKAVQSVAFSPDGTRLATASLDGTTKVWSVASGQELFTLLGHTGGVHGVAFSPDGTRLATAGQDRTVHLYVLELEELMMLARTRVTRALTSEECQKYLHREECSRP
jgi:WD40 repeat protein